MKKIMHVLSVLLMSFVMMTGAFVPAAAEDKEFDTFLEEEAIRILSNSYGEFHFDVIDYKKYNISKPKIELLTASYEEFANNVAEMQATLDRLHQFDYNALDERQQHDYLAYEKYLKAKMAIDQFPDYKEIFNPRCGDYFGMITMLTEFVLYDRESADDWLALMADYPRMMNELGEFTKQQAAKGHFMSDELLDESLQQLQEFIDQGEDNPLIILYSKQVDALEDLSDAEKTEYKNKNIDLVLNTVYPSIQEIRTVLESLRGSRSVSGSNYGYEDGRAYYEALANLKCSSDAPLDEKRDYLQKCMTDLFQYQLSHFGNPLSKPGSFESAEDLMAYLGENLQDFPAGPELNYTMSNLDPCVANPNVMAYYLMPPIDNYNGNVIRINADNVKDNLVTMYTTLAHEGLPGHMYQVTWYYSQPDTKLLRHVIDAIGYGEGWAQYAQRFMLHRSSLSEADAEYQTITILSAYTMQAYVDVLVNGYGLDAQGVSEALAAVGMKDVTENTLDELINGAITSPGQILPYGFGQCKMWEFNERAHASLGDDFNLEEYNLQILKYGQRDFDIVENDLQKYVESKGKEFVKDFKLFEQTATEESTAGMFALLETAGPLIIGAVAVVGIIILALLFFIIRGIIRAITGKKKK